MGDRLSPLRVAFLDPHAFTRHCLAELMRSVGLDVIALADAGEAAARAPERPVDAVLARLDSVALWNAAVIEDLRRISQAWPEAPLLALAPFENADAGLDAARMGFSGCLSPAITGRQLVDALRLVAAGGVFVGPVPAAEPRRFLPAPKRNQPASVLTPREAEVLAMLRQGKPNKMIAFELDMAENTVKVHVGRILKKLGAANRTAVANPVPHRWD
ncbi:MAG: response regulator transcription factor [Rhodospirillales bacterium]|nr:response regulator transcription factor [Rhodospirillales bacterium]